MKKRKLSKERHDINRLLRNTQRKNENQIRLEIQRVFETSRLSWSSSENQTEQHD